MSAEQWRAIPGYEGFYEVSDMGRVRSLPRVTRYGRRWSGQVLRSCAHPNGHLQVHLCVGQRRRTHWVHRLVLSAFTGPSPDGTEALHDDGDPANNALLNLRWGTHSDNIRDQVRHGSHFWASKDQCAQGHPYDETNTYLRVGESGRKCRTCMRAAARKVNERRRIERAERKAS